uniref:RING-type domain-containing protein n=1 Tax=Meloidogyne incognita TaxID=6306 RepID=A0A914KYA6_MELIC
MNISSSSSLVASPSPSPFWAFQNAREREVAAATSALRASGRPPAARAVSPRLRGRIGRTPPLGVYVNPEAVQNNVRRAVIDDDDDDDDDVEVVEVTPPSRPAYFFRENGLELEVPEDDEDNEGLGAREVKKFALHVVTLPPNFDAQEEECFCQEPFAGTRVVFMACLHKMHYNCFVQWAQGSRVCPYCRRDMLHGAAVDGRARDGQGSSSNT